MSAEKQKEIVDKFKAADTDGDMRLSKQEITDYLLKEYQKTGKLPEGYDNLGDYIADKMKDFEAFDENKDKKLNIDEFENMSAEINPMLKWVPEGPELPIDKDPNWKPELPIDKDPDWKPELPIYKEPKDVYKLL